MKKVLFFILLGGCILCCQLEQDEPDVNKPDESEIIDPKEREIIEIEMPCVREEPPWDYKVKNFTEEWEQLTTEERTNNCQIPENVLDSLSTDDLVEICMRNPLLIAWSRSFYHFDDAPDGLFENFNGARELFKREDAYKGLLKWYQCALENCNVLYCESCDGEIEQERATLTIHINIATLLLSRYESPADAKENYVEIVRQLTEGSEKMAMFSYPETETYCFLNYPNCFARAKILIKIDERNLEKIPLGYQNPIFGYFLPAYFCLVDGKDCCDTYEETIRIIDELSYQIIKEK